MKHMLFLFLGFLSLGAEPGPWPREKSPPFQEKFGDWAISESLFEFIIKNVEHGKTILELGSGFSSGQFAKNYNVYAIEHDPNFLNVYENVHYIFAPICNHWYNPEILEKELPLTYDVVIVDGPPGGIGRMGFFDHLRLFNTNSLLIFDDVNRSAEYQLMEKTAGVLGKKFTVVTCENKSWGYLHD